MMALWPKRSHGSPPGPKVTSATFGDVSGSVGATCCVSVPPRQTDALPATMRRNRTLRIGLSVAVASGLGRIAAVCVQGTPAMEYVEPPVRRAASARGHPAQRAAFDLFCSLIPGANASSLPVTTGFTVLSAVGDQPPHHGVRRR